jgi:ATP-dependent Clp protease ATP-binding subunit ClpA
MWWKRLRKYINIKQFAEDDLPSLLKDRFFHNRVSFSTFVVTVCVVDFEELFQLLDNMGIPSRVAPPLLMHELYELCEECNPFLTFENVQKYTTDKDPSTCDGDDCQSGNKAASAGTSNMGKYANNPKKKKKTFKDVPKEDLLNLANNMKVSLIGQDAAIESLVEAIQRACVGLKDPDKPIGSFLFAGTTGCGKTLTSKVLANELIKDKKNLTIIDCSEYSADHEYSKLIGAPAGYVGFENGGILTNAILKNPFSVVVFDEIEKASHKVFQLLLQILDEGRLTDNKGTSVPFKDTVIIMTSNIGVEDINSISKTIGFGDVGEVTAEKKEKAIEGALKKKFKPEFINRIDEIIYFNDLKKEDFNRIIDIELYKLNDNLQANDTEYKNLTLDFDGKVKELIFSQGINEEYGARPLKRAIEKIVSAPLAIKLLSEKIDSEAVIKVSAKKEKATFGVKVKVVEPPFYLDADHSVME